MSTPAAVLDDDQRAFLARAMRSFLFVNRRDGGVTGWPMTLLSRGDDALWFNTYRSSAKARLLGRDGRVGVLVEHDGRALVVAGDAALVPHEEAASVFGAMVRTDGFVSPEQAARTVQRLVEGKRCLFRVEPVRVRWEVA